MNGLPQDIVIHIGFPKTASSALQDWFFPTIAGVSCVTQGHRHSGGTPGYRELSKRLCVAAEGDYSTDELHTFLRENVGAAPATLLVSDESLTGWMSLGSGYRERIASRIHAVLPGARILVVVRNQRTIIRSFYAQYVREGGHVAFRRFLANEAPGFEFDRSYFRYDETVALYQSLFGAQQVRVLAFEQLGADQQGFLEAILEFVKGGSWSPTGPLDLPHTNRSPSAPAQWALRKVNRLLRRSQYNAKALIADVAWELFLRRAILKLEVVVRRARELPELHLTDRRRLGVLVEDYEDGNARLADLTGLPLRTYDYPMPTAGL